MNDLKIGTIVSIHNEPYIVQYSQHVQMGRGEPILRTKMKNLITGKILSQTYKSGDQLEEADLVYKKSQFLYKDDENLYFMDTESFEQFFIEKPKENDPSKFMNEGDEVDVMCYEDRPISVRLPIKANFRVKNAPPGIKGDTAQGSVTKPVELETGYIVNVPLFIKEGELIKINTETGEYVERVKNE